MKYVLMLFFIFSFVSSANSFGCFEVDSMEHYSDSLSSVSYELNSCHDANDSNQEDHATNDCECHCHGHNCKTVSIKRLGNIANLEPNIYKVPFPLFGMGKLSGYQSQIIRPPIS